MSASTPNRPEERHRGHDVEAPGWADTVPAWFRSEAFAEDLAEAPCRAPGSARVTEHAMKAAPAQSLAWAVTEG